MKYGAIDIGTNSMRLLLSEMEGSNFIERKKIIDTTRLGLGVDEFGNISEEAIQRNLEALRKFKEICDTYGCEKIVCVGTAALRNAKNKYKFISMAKELTGIDVDVIDGDKEAYYGYKGVVGGITLDDTDTILVIDIGGGSTELILGDSKKIYYEKSIDLGALVMSEIFASDKPESEELMGKMREYIKNKIMPTIDYIKSKNYNLTTVGIGGTITSVSAINQKLETYSMDKIHESTITISNIESQIKYINSKKIEDRRKIIGLQPKRAEIILPGELILEEIMKELGINSIKISEYDNLEGVLYCVSNK
ncbi:Ppx/GppA phosphatase family protein [Peptostreptococcus faecalis]|uniref:Ppx/GppA phosphatase family protein n=1 Tax=Peptostreptococcus faecalis TaxID=2045015 RepID=UPI000C7E6804|nr:Ppx/GppA phosphatase family protein [Peptostreptococcus faecalis]